MRYWRSIRPGCREEVARVARVAGVGEVKEVKKKSARRDGAGYFLCHRKMSIYRAVAN